MSIQLHNRTIIESKITSYKIDVKARKDYSQVYIAITVVGGECYDVNAHYNIEPNAMINNEPAEKYIKLYHWLTTEKNVNKIIKQLKNLK